MMPPDMAWVARTLRGYATYTDHFAETMKEAISSLRGWANKRAVQAGDTYMPSSRMKKPSINRYKKMTMN